VLGLAAVAAMLVAGVRFPGALLAGLFYGFYAEILADVEDVTTFYTLAAVTIAALRAKYYRVTALDITFGAFVIYHAGSAIWLPNTMFGTKAALTFATSAGAVYLLSKLIFATDRITDRFVEFAVALCVLGIVMPPLFNQIGGVEFGRFKLDFENTNVAVGLVQSLTITITAAIALAPVAWRCYKPTVLLPIASLFSAAPFLFSTGTRSALIGLCVGLSILILPRLRPLPFLAGSAAILSALPLIVIWASRNPPDPEGALARILALDTYLNPNHASVAARLEQFQVAWRIFADNPVLGPGIGGFTTTSPGAGGYPHNFFLELASNSGVVGLTLAIATIACAVTTGLRYRVASIPDWGWFLLAILVSGFAIQQVSFSLPMGKPLYLIGILSGLFSGSTESSSRSRRAIGSSLPTYPPSTTSTP